MFLRPSDTADPSAFLGYNLKRVKTGAGIALYSPDPDSRFALGKENVCRRTEELMSIFAEEIAKNAKWHDFQSLFYSKLGQPVRASMRSLREFINRGDKGRFLT
jgi:hypothetical protein